MFNIREFLREVGGEGTLSSDKTLNQGKVNVPGIVEAYTPEALKTTLHGAIALGKPVQVKGIKGKIGNFTLSERTKALTIPQLDKYIDGVNSMEVKQEGSAESAAETSATGATR